MEKNIKTDLKETEWTGIICLRRKTTGRLL
jgi:hypothetical protein